MEYAASIGGLVSVSLTLFRGCIQAFEIVKSAAQLGREGDNFRCKLELEEYKLLQWAERAGLEEQPSDRLNWNLVASILNQLETLLSDTQALKKRYRLELQVLDTGSNISLGETSALRQTGFSKLLSKLRPDFPLASSRIIHDNNGPVKKLRWAVFDKEKAAKLVGDIVYFNSCLYGLLDTDNQDYVKAALASLLRDIISRSNVNSELEVIKQLLSSASTFSPAAVASAARLKQIRLVLGLGPDLNSIGQTAERAPPDGLKLRLRQLKPSLLLRESSGSPPEKRELARYKSSPVLIEWKSIQKESEKELKTRIDQIAILLNYTSDDSFRSLPCLGILPKHQSYESKDDNTVCYGLVFDLALPTPIPSSPSPPIIRPLSTLYPSSRRPSLNERCAIALALAETVLQLHTSGWLHKGIRSENVLFIDSGVHRWQDGNAFGPYLAGYEYARPTNSQTEMMPSPPEHEIYRHPKAQGLARANFRMSFDLFALGCVLLEVGLWMSLLDILRRVASQSPQNDHLGVEKVETISLSGKLDWVHLHAVKAQLLQNEDLSRQKELADIAFYAGNTFQEAISLCLYADNDDPDDEDIDVPKKVVNLLQQSRF
ncbi:MAG: hypothetical protein L6R37_008138 [Teloschistes peruensis]|nr:MAG: hypothetical protein L6R37_008138 [Teloschistes peruensis]